MLLFWKGGEASGKKGLEAPSGIRCAPGGIFSTGGGGFPLSSLPEEDSGDLFLHEHNSRCY